MKNRRSGFQTTVLVSALAAVGLLAWYALGPGGWFVSSDAPALVGASVQRGPLRISVVERGNLKAADSVSLKSEIEGSTTILWLIDEGTYVEEGDLLCDLDATDLIDRKFQRELSVRNAEASYIKAKQAFEIQKSQNESDIAGAEQNLAFAQQDLRKFREGEKDSLLAKGEEAITLATEEFARAADKLKWSEELESKGFLTATELEADRLSKNRAGIMLEQAKRDFDLLRDFQVPRDEDELVADLAEAERELVRVELTASARLVDYEAAMNTGKATFDLESDKLRDILDQIAKAKVYAPRAGMVVYGKEPGGRYGQSDPIQEGTQVRERQELITIPSAQGMIAEVSLHESVLKQVEVGQSCVVKVDAAAGREFAGEVSFVALLPDQNSWWANPNQRLYRTEVSIGNGSKEMRPGMSCSIEILVEEIDDTLFVPVQAVFRHQGANVAFVDEPGGPDVREVEVGRYNDRWVQVLEGLEEGQTVYLSPPTGFTLTPGSEEGSERPTPPTPSAGRRSEGSAAKGGGDSGERSGRGEGEGKQPEASAEASAEGGERPTAEQLKAYAERMEAEGKEMPSAEQIEAWKKARALRGAGGASGDGGGTSTSGS